MFSDTMRVDATFHLPDLAKRTENVLAAAALLTLAALPVLELVLRALFGTGLPGTSGYVQNLTLWVGYLGAMLASREGRHLHLSTGGLGLPPRLQRHITVAVAAVSATVGAGLFWASLQFVWLERESAQLLGGWLPIWFAEAILPIGFAVITLRFAAQAGGWSERAVVCLVVAAAAALGSLLPALAAQLVWPALVVLVVAAVFQAPIFVLVGGAALILFFAAEVPLAAISVANYRIVVSPLIPTIPLFTLAGYLLAEGGARRRLIRLFRALCGWLPGGQVIAATLLCAFFTSFTGASGVVILALGGLLLPVLVKNGYPERFSVGLLTATGSIGLLFPPSIAVILYASIAAVPIPDLFLAGLIPGLIMVTAVGLYGVREGLRARVPRAAFDAREALAALWDSKWELMVPAIVLYGVFGGFTTLTEAAALVVVYVLLVEVAIHRDLDLFHDVPGIVVNCATLIGGVFVILGAAFGLANYFVDAQIPNIAVDWVKENVESRLLFLLALNVFLLVVGCLLDIFSAIVVVVPLILPISQVFGIHPAHLGIIFLANLELGYITPPVGLNLFLAAYRFDRPMLEVCKGALPFLFVLLSVVLLITYVPELTIIGAGGD